MRVSWLYLRFTAVAFVSLSASQGRTRICITGLIIFLFNTIKTRFSARSLLEARKISKGIKELRWWLMSFGSWCQKQKLSNNLENNSPWHCSFNVANVGKVEQQGFRFQGFRFLTRVWLLTLLPYSAWKTIKMRHNKLISLHSDRHWRARRLETIGTYCFHITCVITFESVLPLNTDLALGGHEFDAPGLGSSSCHKLRWSTSRWG